MKSLIIFQVLMTASLCAFAADIQPSAVSATASLKDGSTVKGEFIGKRIVGSTAFMEKLALDPALVKNIQFNGTNGVAKVELANGDRFSMNVNNGGFPIRTILGDLKVPRKSVRTLAFSTSHKSSGADGDGLVFHCTFDDEASVATPAVGPGGKLLGDSGHLFRKGHSGNALLCPVSMTAATFLLPDNFLSSAGCIEFWALSLKTRDSLRDGGDPRFFTISRESDNITIGQLDIVNNDGGGHSGFATRTVIGSTASCESMSIYRLQQLYPDGKWYDWHHYAISWDINGIDGFNRKIALFIDGEITPAPIESVNEKSVIEQVVSSPLRLSFSGNCNEAPMHNSKSPFLIDEFKIWNFAKTGFKEASQD